MSFSNSNVLPSLYMLTDHLISDFNAGDLVKVIYVQTFNNSQGNKCFVTIDDVNHKPTKERSEKRCTIQLSDLIKNSYVYAM